MKNKNIDYYGNSDNYIHLKFGDVRKNYNFTPTFIEKYPDFAREYTNYFECKESEFKNPLNIVSYAYNAKIPVHFYFNYTDTPAKGQKEIMDYLIKENTWSAQTGNIILKQSYETIRNYNK